MKILGCFLKRSKSIRTLSLLFGFLCLAFSASFGQVPDIVVKNKVFIRADQGPAGMNKDLGAINVDVPGHYRIFAHTFYNSGDEQLNESYYLQIRYQDASAGLPADINAGPYKIVVDDPGPRHGAKRDAGLFFLPAGLHVVELHHYFVVAKKYPSLVNNFLGGTESVRVDSLRIVYEPVVDGAVRIEALDGNADTVPALSVIKAGESYQYRLIVRNDQLDLLHAATLVFRHPEIVQLDQFSLPVTAQEAGQVSWQLPDIAGEDSLIIAMSSHVLDNMTDGYSPINTAATLLPQYDVDWSNNDDRHLLWGYKEPAVPVQSAADLSMNLTVVSDSLHVVAGDTTRFAKPGELLDIAIDVINHGPATASAIEISCMLPEYVAASGFSHAPTSSAGRSITWRVAQLAAFASVEITFTGTVDSKLTKHHYPLTHEALVSASNDTTPANNYDSETVYSVTRIDDLSRLDLQFDMQTEGTSPGVVNGALVDVVFAGERYDYRLQALNTGPITAQDVKVWSSKPDSTTFSDFTIPPSYTWEEFNFWRMDSLRSAELFEVSFAATVANAIAELPFELPSKGGTYAAKDSVLDNNIDSTVVYVVSAIAAADLQAGLVAETDSTLVDGGNVQQFVNPGGDIRYTITITNNGPDAASNISVVNWLPVFVEAKGFSEPPAFSDSVSLGWDIAAIEPNTFYQISFTGLVDSSLKIDKYPLSDSVVVAWPADPVPENNTAKGTVYVAYTPPLPEKRYDLSVDLAAHTDTTLSVNNNVFPAVVEGDVFQYEITMRNSGPDSARDIRLWNIVPQSVSPASFSIEPLSQNGDSLIWLFDSLASGDSINILYNASVSDSLSGFPLELVARCGIEAAGDTNGTNNSDSISVYVLERILWADLEARVFARTDSMIASGGDTMKYVAPGGEVHYSIAVLNHGPETAENVLVANWIPGPVILKQISPEPFEATAALQTWQFSSIPAGTSVSISFVAEVDSAFKPEKFSLGDSVRASYVLDPNPGNDWDQETVFVVYTEPPQDTTYDLSFDLAALTDTTVVIDNQVQPAVLDQGTFSYRLTVENSGPANAHGFDVWNKLPRYVIAHSFSPPPENPQADSLFWHIDSLKVGESLNIIYKADVADSIQDFPHKLLAYGGLDAPGDTLASNDRDSASVYVIERTRFADVELHLSAVTDSFAVQGNDTLRYAKPGGEIRYTIVLVNNGPDEAHGVRLVNKLPQFTSANQFSPEPMKNDSLGVEWRWAVLAPSEKQTITFRGLVSETLAIDSFPLVDSAAVMTNDDPNGNNNSAVATVYLSYKSPPTETDKYDLAVDVKATTDTTVSISGMERQAVVEGHIFHYEVTVQNNGPATARNIRLRNIFADSIRIDDYEIAPQSVRHDTAFWNFDSLAAAKSLSFIIGVHTAKDLPSYPFLLLHRSQVFGEKDTLLTNNADSVVVYALVDSNKFEPQFVDLVVEQFVQTDSFAVVDQDTSFYVREGEDITVTIIVSNRGNADAEDVTLVVYVPDSATVISMSPQAGLTSEDSLQWSVGNVPAGASKVFQITYRVSRIMPIGTNQLVTEAKVLAPAQADQTPDDNRAMDSILNIVNPPEPIVPLIEAQPAEVDVGDSIYVRISVPREVRSYDLWVHTPASTDTTFADQFISANRLVAGEWLDVVPAYVQPNLTTGADVEPVTFELRVVDYYGALGTALASAAVRSNNYLVLDRNVFEADNMEPLGIKFKLSSRRLATLDIYDINGYHITQVAQDVYNGGWSIYYWDGLTKNSQKVGSGVYLVTLRSGEFNAYKKFILAR